MTRAGSAPNLTCLTESRAPSRRTRDGRDRDRQPRHARSTPVATDSFFRDLVWGLRNGPVAVLRDGTVDGDERRRLPDSGPGAAAVGHRQAVQGGPAEPAGRLPHRRQRVRAVAPAEPGGDAAQEHRQGDWLHAVAGPRPPTAEITGAALFFKDLTRVEQLEERERLRDRLAALGEMAAAIAHEVKNPLAGIEVMAGILKRQLADSPGCAVDPRRTSSRKRRWPTRSCWRCSTSSGRSGCRSRTSRSTDAIRDAVVDGREPRAPRRRAGEGRVARTSCRRSRAIRTSCGRSSRTC